MYQSLLATTSTEGLQPLGTPAQRSFELVSEAVRARLSEDHAALFAEPVAAQHGEAIDWHAPREGRGVALADLDEADRTALRGRLDQLVQDIRAEAQRLADSALPTEQRLAEALQNALEIPGEDMIRAIRAPDGSLHPVLLHWAWLRDEQRAVRGVLSTIVARPAPSAQAEAAPQRSKAPLWWLLLLGWLLLAVMLAAILWLLIRPCGLWRTGPDFCPVPEAAIAAALTETRAAQDEVAALEREIALTDRGCHPTIPVLPQTPEAPAAPPTEAPMPAPAFPVPKPAPDDADRKAALERAQVQGVIPGALTFVMEWQGGAKADLTVTCPAGPTVGRDNSGDCNATHALADAPGIEAVTFAEAPSGLYTVTATTTGNDEIPVKLHMFRQDGPSQSYAGMLGPKEPFTTTISISR